MAQALFLKRNVRTKPKPATKKTLNYNFSDWDSYLYSFWLEKMALNPGFYDDARESHMSGLCKCGCTRAFVLEVRRKKK
jgi:hypothetical protein